MTSAEKQSSTKEVEVIDLLRQLLARGDHDGVIEVVVKLMSTHDKQLRSLLERARRQSTKNEGTSSAQLSLLVDEIKKLAAESSNEADATLAAVAPVPPPPPGPKLGPKVRPPRRRPLPDLEKVDNYIKVPAAQRPCSICGEERKCIGHETSSVLDIIPAKAIIRIDHREKLACEEHGEVTTAPLGDKVIPGGAYGATLVSDMVVSKYEDGLPLHRLAHRYERLGLDIPSSSMCDQITWATDLLAPISSGILNEILDCEVMHLDGTSLPALDRDDPKGIKIGCLWGYVGVRYRVEDGVSYKERLGGYLYTSTSKKWARKSGEIGPANMLEVRRTRKKPHVVADADGRFDESFTKDGLVEVGCNMHARRYFVKALDAGDQRAAMPLAAFKKLYDIEERLKDKPPDERRSVRQSESRLVYEALVCWCATHKQSEPPSSRLAKAVSYLLNHHVALMRFLDDGVLPIDNGEVERLHRTPAQGRRAYLFAGSDEGGHRAAIAYTVISTCRLLDINPMEYLADILPRLARGIVPARDLPPLMPWAWARARQAN